MNDLVDSADKELTLLRNFVEQYKETEQIPDAPQGMPPLKYLDQELWRVEIDIENANDLCRRLGEDTKQTVKEKLKSFFPSIF